MKKNSNNKETLRFVTYETLPPSKSRMIVGVILTLLIALSYFLLSL